MSSIPPLPAPSSARARRPVRTWDLVLSIVLVVLLLVVAAVLVVFAPFLAFASDSCGSSVECNTGQLGVGILIAFVGPVIVALLSIAATIVLLVLRRLAFWAPITGMVLSVVIWGFGAALVFSSVPGMTF